MRAIHTHETNECNEAIRITADERDLKNGNASHYYELRYPDAVSPECTAAVGIKFQHGPIKEAGVNGITNEALLAVLIDRVEGFQAGPYACMENELALVHLKKALEAFTERTLNRIERGVEGTNTI
jgi:hypothetical protein